MSGGNVCPMFCNFYAVKNHKIANFSTNDEAGEKLRIDFESLKFCKFTDARKVWPNKNTQTIIKLAADFYLMGETSSFENKCHLIRM